VSRRLAAALLATLTALAAAPAAFGAFADDEARNFSKTQERDRYITKTPSFQSRLQEAGAASPGEVAAILASDPARSSMTQNLCHQHIDGCAGDVRYYDWDDTPGNVRRPVLWTARSGATISGHVWEVQGAGTAPKPGVVITNGSVQASEELYWLQAAKLAEAGYVVLTWDPQTQGRSDRSGEAPTETENATPQSVGAFTDGTQDALDFFESTPSAAFEPRNSRTNAAVNHAAKQNARVAAGKNAAFNPLHASLDRSRIGIAGNSLGARAVSQIGSSDTRVDAVVAWDALSADFTPRVPGLGLSGDYGIGGGCSAGVTPVPCTSPLDPQAANGASRAFSTAGVPTGQINTRAGTHFESAFIPNSGFPATLRGIDQLSWYTVAWMDRWVKGDGSADVRLLTSRWHRDPKDFSVDPAGRGNLFSANLRSRFDFPRADGSGQVHCEDLRQGCGLLVNDAPPLSTGSPAATGQTTGTASKPLPCASSLRATRRLDLSRRTRMRVRIRLRRRSRIAAVVRRRGPRRWAVTSRRKGAGSGLISLRVSRRAKAGRHRLKVRISCAGTRSQVVYRRVRFVP
jgi:dienelactone hydrolase